MEPTTTIEVTELEAQIIEDILSEIQHQHSRWSAEFDKSHTANDWIAYIAKYAGRAADLPNSTEAQEAWTKVAALAFSAMMTYERNRGLATTTAG